jgi:hypothetical protein
VRASDAGPRGIGHPPPLMLGGAMQDYRISIQACSKVHGASPIAGVRRGDSGPLGSGLCRMLELTFREGFFLGTSVNRIQASPQ